MTVNDAKGGQAQAPLEFLKQESAAKDRVKKDNWNISLMR